MASILLILLVGGLLTGLYFYYSVRTFVAESQLVIFPIVNSDTDLLPRIADDGPEKAPDDESPTNDPLATPELGEDGQPKITESEQAEVESDPGPELPIPTLEPPEEETSSITPVIPVSPVTDRLTVLVMGIDRREDEQEGPWRTDSMILISIDPESDSIAILSTPRDLFVTIPNYGNGEYQDRINTAFFYGDLTEYPGGGPALAMETIRRNFGIAVDRYLVVDFNGFEQIVDLIGGIEVDVPKQIIDTRYPTEDYRYMTIRFDPGLQTMSGEQALIYSRTRKSTSDFDRAVRQQQVIMAVRDQVLSKNLVALLTPSKLSQLYFALKDSIQTDMPVDEIWSFAQVANNVTEDNIKRLVIDPNMVSNYRTNKGASVLLPNWDIILPQVEDIFGIPLLTILPHPYIPTAWSPSVTPISKPAPLTVATPELLPTWTLTGNNTDNRSNNQNNDNNTNDSTNNDTNNSINNNNSGTVPTFVVGVGTPWPTSAPGMTPWPTFTPSSGTPWPTFTPSSGTPWPTFTPSSGTPWPTFTPSSGTPWPTFTPSSGTPWPTFTPSSGTPWPTFTPSSGNLTPEPTSETENVYLTPEPTYPTSESTAIPEDTVYEEATPVYEEATPVYEEATPIPEDSSYEPTVVIEDLAVEPTVVLEELSYDATAVPDSPVYEQTPTPELP